MIRIMGLQIQITEVPPDTFKEAVYIRVLKMRRCKEFY